MNKTVFITGASSGIGKATARAIVAAGGRVVLLARSKDKLDSLAAELGESALASTLPALKRHEVTCGFLNSRPNSAGASNAFLEIRPTLLGPPGEFPVPLSSINQIFDGLQHGGVASRVVLELARG